MKIIPISSKNESEIIFAKKIKIYLFKICYYCCIKAKKNYKYPELVIRFH